MTRYAFDSERNALVATWGTGRGDVAATVAVLPVGVTREQSLRLASNLTALSRFQWRTYTHPASAVGDPEVPNSQAWRRARAREDFADVEEGLRKPNLPSADGAMVVSYSRIVESAHRIGRVLHAVGDGELLDRVVAEVRAEQVAVEAAELGDLSGRAQQAVELSRPDASPVQVQAADTLLRAEPLGSIELFTDLDPAAASVAAAHWLQAAADVAAERAGYVPTEVVLRADDIEALHVETPTLVLERLNAGESPRQVITDLIADAMAVAEGRLRNPQRVIQRLAEIEEQASKFEPNVDSTRAALLAEFQASRLDPARPAIDLLEDLLGGIRGCWLIYREEVIDDAIADEDIDDLTAEEEKEADAAARAEADDLFAAEVRAEADAHRDRLL